MCKYFAALKLRGRVSFNDDVDLIRSLASNNGDLSRVELLRLDRLLFADVLRARVRSS